MKKLYVYADFDWLNEIELIGELGYESLRGSDSYCFTFSDDWLKKHGDLFLSDDLNNYPGQQYTQPGKDIFGCFSDALPDRWGRTLLLRREQLAAMEEKRPVRRLSSFDFLTGIDDFSRMGAFRFKENPDGDFINVSESLKIPPLTDIRGLIAASAEIEKSEENNMLPDRKWIAQLVQPGTSLGGARPKANVGHIPSRSTNVGFSFTIPFINTLKLFISLLLSYLALTESVSSTLIVAPVAVFAPAASSTFF